MSRWDSYTQFEILKGRILTNIEGLEEGSEQVTFTCDDGTKFIMDHSQDCCENVRVLEVIGDAEDLIGSEILTAEEAVNPDDAPAVSEYDYDSSTWTFYKLSTRKGYVDIRWLGESNGYYSESVDFYEVK